MHLSPSSVSSRMFIPGEQWNIFNVSPTYQLLASSVAYTLKHTFFYAEYNRKVCLIPQRYVLALMCFAGLASSFMLRVCLNIAITEMASSNKTFVDDKQKEPGPGFFHWSESTQQLILGSFYWGYVATHIPGGYIAHKFGGKQTFGLSVLTTAIFTLVIPPAVQQGYGWLLLCRVIAGLAEGTTFPGLSDLLARWIPVDERGLLGSLVFAGAQMGTIIGTLVTGKLLEAYTGRWDIVFYVFGSLGILWFVAWWFMCYGDPWSHPFITEEEKTYLEEKIGNNKNTSARIPWLRIMTSSPVLALMIAQIGHDWGFYTMVTNLPKYMKDILGFEIGKIGLFTSISFFGMWICSIFSGWLADLMLRKKWMSVTRVRKSFTAFAHIMPSIMLVSASYAGSNETAVISCFVLTLLFMGAFFPGTRINALDLSPNYAGSIMAVVNGIGGLTGIITPYLIGEIATHQDAEEWRLVFWITFGVKFVTLIGFVIWGSGEVQPWNDLKNKQKQHDKESAIEEAKP